MFRACRARPSVLGRKGPSTRKRGERGRKSAQFRGTGHRTRGGTYKGKARWDAECREADFRPYSASCAFGRLWPRTGRADRARERGVYSPKVDLKVWPVAAAGRRPAIFSPSRVRCEVQSQRPSHHIKKRRFVGDADGPPGRVSGRGFRVPVAPGGGFHLPKVAWSSDQHR